MKPPTIAGPRLACPRCVSGLAERDGGLVCGTCGAEYRVSEGVPDLRLPGEKQVLVPFVVRAPHAPARGFRRPRPIPLNPAGLDVDPDALPGFTSYGNGITRELASWFPRSHGESLMLDLGCASRRAETICRLTGHAYVGFDIEGPVADVLGSGDALPFLDESFEFVFSLAVLASTPQPVLVCREVRRVLKPGGVFIATTQFLEPATSSSRHHVSSLGVQDWLEAAGLDLVHLEANTGWSGLDAMLELGYFGRLPSRVKRGVGATARAAARWRHRRDRDPAPAEGFPERYTGGFRFVCRRLG